MTGPPMFPSILERIQQLGDLDLAVLLTQVAGQHCIITSDSSLRQRIPQELRLICQESFHLQPAIIDCSAATTVDELNESILVEVEDEFEDAAEQSDRDEGVESPHDYSTGRQRTASRFASNARNELDERRIADVVIAANLDLASHNVQIQILELLRTGRIFTRMSMHTSPKDGFFIAVLSTSKAKLFPHLNDMFALSHHHSFEDGLPRLNSEFDIDDMPPRFVKHEINELRHLAKAAHMTGEVAQYLHNIVGHMRLNRYVRTGVTAAATRHLRSLSSALAPMHGIDYVTPSLVGLAARKVYPHRLVLATPETERSLQWGSDPSAVKQLLAGMTIEGAIEDVLASVETPL